MDEYIEREAMRDALYDANSITMEGVKIINQFPSADVAPVVHGRWEWIGPYRYNDDGMIGTCSVCKERLRLFAYNYCPNCGAKMDGDSDAKAD